MKLLLIPIVVLATCLPTAAQQFQQKSAVKLPAGSRTSQVLWADADNDSLLDVIVADTSHHQFSATAYTGMVNGTIISKPLFSSPLPGLKIQLHDFNQDNKLDIVGAGPLEISAWLNQGNFLFSQTPETVIAAKARRFSFSDLNNDGQQDIVLTNDSTAWQLFKNVQTGFRNITDSNPVIVQDIAVADFDGNGFPDIALSGKNELNEPFLTVIQHKSNFDTLRVVQVPVTHSGRIATGDLDHDGFFDILISGLTPAGQSLTQSFINHDSAFTIGNTYAGVNATDVVIADFDADGLADVSLFGKDAGGNPAHQITTGSGSIIVVPSDKVLQISFGDFDRDGDLDLIQLNDTLGMVLLENKTTLPNARPTAPSNAGAAVFYSHLFTWWDKSTDDLTSQASLTYDITVLAGDGIYYGGEFDQQSFRRLTVSNGNQGTNTFALLKAPLAGGTVFVQAIDNSFFESKIAQGGAMQCAIDHRDIASCNNAPVVLDATSATAKWFSFSRGFLGEFSALTVKNPATDTIFSFVRSATGCPKLTVYSIVKPANDTLRQAASFTVCKDQSVPLSADAQWQEISWTANKQSVGSGSPFLYVPQSSGIVVGFGKNSNGCFLLQRDNVTISIPVATVAAPEFAISAGEQVQLEAGGGESYFWSPSDYLDNPAIPNPRSTPLASIAYIVTVTDSIGCQTSATVRIDLQETAYIADLFTPNGKDDPRNEELRLYGLPQATDFHFTVVNRDGAVVFETNDVTNATATGWNGTHNGSAQPTGVYYWKVEGVAAGGQPLRLNGKKQGSVILIR